MERHLNCVEFVFVGWFNSISYEQEDKSWDISKMDQAGFMQSNQTLFTTKISITD